MVTTFYRNHRPLQERPSQGSAAVDRTGRDINGTPGQFGQGKPERRDFAGLPNSAFDGTHLSKDARGRLGSLGPEIQGKIARAASADPAGDGMRHFSNRAEHGWPSVEQQFGRHKGDPAQGGPGDFRPQRKRTPSSLGDTW